MLHQRLRSRFAEVDLVFSRLRATGNSLVGDEEECLVVEVKSAQCSDFLKDRVKPQQKVRLRRFCLSLFDQGFENVTLVYAFVDENDQIQFFSDSI